MPIFKLNAFLAVSWFLAIVAYLAILNNITVNGYKIKKINDEVLKLENENKSLALGLSDKQSIRGVMAKIKTMNMVDAGTVSYLDMPQTAVAKK